VDIKKQPMFFGENIGLVRFDRMRYPVFEKLTVEQTSNFWQPHDVNLANDRADFDSRLLPNQKHIMVRNLGYQTLLDSVQSRLTVDAFRPWCSLPEVDDCIRAWSFFEGIHNKAYQHLVNNLYPNPSDFYDHILDNPAIVSRADAILRYYDRFIAISDYVKVHGYRKHSRAEHKRAFYMAVASVYALESIRFYVSFVCTFALAEQDLMIGSGKQMKLIARDEALHVGITLNMLRLWPKESKEQEAIAEECAPEVLDVFKEVVDQETAWADYLFSEGDMLGLNTKLMQMYLEHLANKRLKAIGLEQPFANKTNPFTWMNRWTTSSDEQVAPQETEITAYKVSALNRQVEVGQLDTDF
jgi:ribonucleoside-diphosphate reductase beta chain